MTAAAKKIQIPRSRGMWFEFLCALGFSPSRSLLFLSCGVRRIVFAPSLVFSSSHYCFVLNRVVGGG